MPSPNPLVSLPQNTPAALPVSVTVTITETSSYMPSPPPSAVDHSSYPTSTPSSPPPYTLPLHEPLSSTANLSFYPPTLSPIPSSIDEPLPSYRPTPRCRAEKYFFWGMVCPLLWLLGISKLWLPEPIMGNGKLADIEGGGAGVDGVSGNWDLTVGLWAEEERVWALRCVWCFGGFVLLAAVLVVVIVEMAA